MPQCGTIPKSTRLKASHIVSGASLGSSNSWITQAEYDQKRAKWRQQQKLHERKLSRLSEVDEQYYITVAYLLDIAARGKELFMRAEPAEKRELIGLLGQNLFLEGRKVGITLYKPFSDLASCNEHSLWLRGEGSNLRPGD